MTRAVALAARRTIAALAVVMALVGAARATPLLLPRLEGHVVDPAQALSARDAAALERRLEGIRRRAGHAIVVLILPALGGEPIEDVAYRAFNAWGIGGAKVDDGVLIVVATAERTIRIETGKGVGGALTDLQANDIIRQRIGPALARGDLAGGLTAGVDAIEVALVAGDVSPPRTLRANGGSQTWLVVVLVLMGLLGIASIFSPQVRAVWRILGPILRILSMFGGGSRGGRNDAYRGGGGRSGGGGSTDRY